MWLCLLILPHWIINVIKRYCNRLIAGTRRQPQMPCKSTLIISKDALLRWNTTRELCQISYLRSRSSNFSMLQRGNQTRRWVETDCSPGLIIHTMKAWKVHVHPCSFRRAVTEVNLYMGSAMKWGWMKNRSIQRALNISYFLTRNSNVAMASSNHGEKIPVQLFFLKKGKIFSLAQKCLLLS